VRRNIETLGGRTELESEEGAGCAFTLVLPAQSGDG
jgi:chemotaxis protein histidine kinase CheA